MCVCFHRQRVTPCDSNAVSRNWLRFLVILIANASLGRAYNSYTIFRGVCIVAWVWERGSPAVCIARFCGGPSGFSFAAGAVGPQQEKTTAWPSAAASLSSTIYEYYLASPAFLASLVVGCPWRACREMFVNGTFGAKFSRNVETWKIGKPLESVWKLESLRNTWEEAETREFRNLEISALETSDLNFQTLACYFHSMLVSVPFKRHKKTL